MNNEEVTDYTVAQAFGSLYEMILLKKYMPKHIKKLKILSDLSGKTQNLDPIKDLEQLTKLYKYLYSETYKLLVERILFHNYSKYLNEPNLDNIIIDDILNNRELINRKTLMGYVMNSEKHLQTVQEFKGILLKIQKMQSLELAA